MAGEYIINRWAEIGADSVEYDRRILDDMLAYIIEYKQRHDGVSPTLRKLCSRFGVASTSTASRLRNELVERGDLHPVLDGATIVNYAVSGGEWRRV